MHSTSKGARGGDPSALRPVTIGPANCEAVTGMSWRHVRDHADELGLEFIEVGAKRVILADRFLAALQRRAAMEELPPERDELAEMRERIARAG